MASEIPRAAESNLIGAPEKMQPLKTLLAASCLFAVANAHGHHHEGHHHHHDDEEHSHHGEDLHAHHEVMTLDGEAYERIISEDKHVWVVKFYSPMCGACKAFQPVFEEMHTMVDGLHWAAINVDNKSNAALAKRMGVMTEGIPNVKLVNAADMPMNVVSGDTPSVAALAAQIKETLVKAGAKKDAAGFYLARGRTEL